MSPTPPTLPARQQLREPTLESMIGGLLRLAVVVVAVLAVVATAAELGLRALGATPGRAGAASHIVPDGWTGFRLRPGVSGSQAVATNDLGMHAPRSYTLEPPPESLRVAVLGSSVVYGLGTRFTETIPGALERELQLAGQRAEVLNFGTHAFTIVNMSALLQAYVHQFKPDVAVVVVDLQVGVPDWPDVRPGAESPEGAIERLGWWAALLKRGTEKSALLALFDDPRSARVWMRRATGLPLRPPSRPSPPPQLQRSSPLPAPAAPAARGTAPGPPEDVRAYEKRRERDLAAPLAAMAAFAAEKSITLYFVTPYGPYFDFTDDELAHMAVHGFLEEAARVHGSEGAALGPEVELITRTIRRVAAHGSAHVIDMLEASRGASLRTSSHFARDGVHLTPAGNLAVARLIASRLVSDLERRPADGD
jgi:lysophospholipase L1-like esterase